MILVTVGTQFFDELIDEVDRLAGAGAFTTFADTAPACVCPAPKNAHRLKTGATGNTTVAPETHRLRTSATGNTSVTPDSHRLETGATEKSGDAGIFAQIGLQQRLPKHIEYVAFDRTLVDKARRADLIITHAGTGSLMEFLPMGRPLIAVANPTKADNHQLEFLHALSAEYDFCWISAPKRLESALPSARVPRKLRPAGADRLGADIAAYISGRHCHAARCR